MRGQQHAFALSVAKLERQGLSLVEALRYILLDPARSHHERGAIGEIWSVSRDGQAVQALLKLFFEQTGKDDLYTTALTLEYLNDQRAVQPLVQALLQDDNPHRRHAAARALGWIRRPGRNAALALAGCLADPAQPQAVREEAAESLAYVGTRETIDALISVLHDPDVRIRFWAVFGLGSSCRGDSRAVRALESMLGDIEVPPGNWWSVGKEALAMLGCLSGEYRMRLTMESRRVLSNRDATDEDRHWAESYC